MLLAGWLVQGLVAAAPPTLPRLDSIGIDGWSLGFTAALTLLTGVLFGLAPALHAAAPNLFGGLSDGAAAGRRDAGRQRFRRGLVVGQIALALVLLVGARLLIRSFGRLRGVDPGFVPEHLLTARLELSPVRYRTNEQVRAYYEELVRRVGGDSRGAVGRGGQGAADDAARAGRLVVPRGRASSRSRRGPRNGCCANWQAVSPRYFETMRHSGAAGPRASRRATGSAARVSW